MKDVLREAGTALFLYFPLFCTSPALNFPLVVGWWWWYHRYSSRSRTRGVRRENNVGGVCARTPSARGRKGETLHRWIGIVESYIFMYIYIHIYVREKVGKLAGLGNLPTENSFSTLPLSLYNYLYLSQSLHLLQFSRWCLRHILLRSSGLKKRKKSK